MSRSYCIVSFCAVFLTAGIGWAEVMVHESQAVPLSDLIAGQTLVVGDKTFSGFGYTKVGDMPEAADVNVIPITSGGHYGVRFQGGFIDLVGGSVSDSLITFSVEAPDPLINAAELLANGAAPGGGVATITETFLPELTTTLLTISSGANMSDSVSFDPPLKKLNVQKDILLLAGDEPATISFVDQVFRQVPEPASMSLAACAAMTCLMVRRRRMV